MDHPYYGEKTKNLNSLKSSDFKHSNSPKNNAQAANKHLPTITPVSTKCQGQIRDHLMRETATRLN